MVLDVVDIDRMPRGGFDASWLDRRLETDRLEYLDRDDVEHRKRKVIDALERGGRVFGQHEMMARIALGELTGVDEPKVLELGAGHGGLSRALLDLRPAAHVTVTDIEPTSVATMADGDLGRHPRAVVRQMDATQIDAAEREYDLAVFAQSFHHLPPRLAARVFAEGTRVADKLLIIDLPRLPPWRNVLQLPVLLPLGMVIPLVHDGCISALRAYSPSALRSLATFADPAMSTDVRTESFGMRGRWQVAVAKR